ncbi:MAG: T9SS type A sorting domain-containing protein [Ignavibacteria bacterium]|jgi:hypothetical protein
MKKIIFFLIIAIFSAQLSYSASIDTNKVWGVTIDGINNLNNIVASLSNLCKKPTTRIVFDEFIPATDYVNAINQIHNVSFIMGELLDSYYMNQYNLTQYVARTNEYVNLLGDKVDIWEVGNEVNGEWLGTISDVVAKIDTAYKIVKSKGKKTELTLYYNYNCYENSQNEMFRWVNQKLSTTMRNGLDYVLISYYEDDCNNLQPNWQEVFDSLHVLFPNSKIGIGECGTSINSKKANYINRYYRMNITTPNYIGGYFWWYYKQDCIPYSSSLWSVLNNAMTTLTGTVNNEIPIEAFLGNNYPNPFNPSTKIDYAIPKNSFVNIKIYDNLGREVSTLVNELKSAGKYSIDFNANNIAAGVYYYKLTSNNFSEVKKMILVK